MWSIAESAVCRVRATNSSSAIARLAFWRTAAVIASLRSNRACANTAHQVTAINARLKDAISRTAGRSEPDEAPATEGRALAAGMGQSNLGDGRHLLTLDG